MSRQAEDTVQLKLRFREELRARLEGAATRNEASLNSEIVRRLEDSFTLADELGGDDALAFFREAAKRIRFAEDKTGKRWTEDYVTWSAAKRLIELTIRDWMPEPPNVEGLIDAMRDETTALQALGDAWRAYNEAWPPSDRPVNALLASALLEASLSPEDRERHDADLARVIEAQRRVDEAKAATAEAERAAAEAKQAGLEIADRIMAAIEYARRMD